MPSSLNHWMKQGLAAVLAGLALTGCDNAPIRPDLADAANSIWADCEPGRLDKTSPVPERAQREAENAVDYVVSVSDKEPELEFRYDRDSVDESIEDMVRYIRETPHGPCRFLRDALPSRLR